ncbi:Uncharacterised protein [Salmonella enterica subsp. enterica serovar Bovismorbificans]|uniref:Uncharacterized protein n=1 Tax=Salmonella enterica subsp. enterica serovar Bovismorbificans TaxID=58097 RepID=A0A655ECV8_SALET|nr:Uncharacterised protein [Salmonella enterica subsp. enterica serovar Bovismorbificans]
MRQPANNAHIFKRHMGAAVMARCHSGIGGDHFDVVTLIIQRHKELIKTATAGKSGKGMHKRFTTGQRQPRRSANHIRLHNTAVNDMLRVVTRHAVHRH